MSQDEHIIRSIVNGDPHAFKELYKSHNERVYNLALSYAQEVHGAEEITQDVFTKVYRNASKFKGGSSVSTWLYRITVNTSLNHIKRNKRHRFSHLDSEKEDFPHFDHPGVNLENKENARFLFKAIESLSTNQKTAFLLSYVEGLPRKEVAAIMDVSLKSVESLLQRAKQNLRERLKKYYPNRGI